MLQNKKSILIILLIIVVICFGIWYVKSDIPELQMNAEAGVCDLTETDLDKQYVRVAGQWQTVSDEFLTPEEFERSENIVDGEPSADAEYFTTRIRLVVPGGKTYALIWDSIDYADRIYINGQWVQDVGTPGKTAAEEVPLTSVVYHTATPQNGAIEIVQQGSGFVDRKSVV